MIENKWLRSQIDYTCGCFDLQTQRNISKLLENLAFCTSPHLLWGESTEMAVPLREGESLGSGEASTAIGKSEYDFHISTYNQFRLSDQKNCVSLRCL